MRLASARFLHELQTVTDSEWVKDVSASDDVELYMRSTPIDCLQIFHLGKLVRVVPACHCSGGVPFIEPKAPGAPSPEAESEPENSALSPAKTEEVAPVVAEEASEPEPEPIKEEPKAPEPPKRKKERRVKKTRG